MRIIRAIVDGQRSPRYLASFRDPNCKNSAQVIEKSLVGNYKPEHVFELKQALALYDYYTKLIAECDRKIEEVCTRLAQKAGPPEKPMPEGKKTRPPKNAPDYDLRSYLYQITGIDLTLVDGVNVLTVQTLLSELGADFTKKFPTFKHFSSWLGTSPQRDISGGKVLKTSTKKTDNRVYTALRIAAMSLHHSNCALGAFYRRMHARRGAPKAITATAHKLARIIYIMLKNKVEYVDLGADYYEKKYKERELRRLRKRAEKLGFALVPQEQGK